MDLTKALAPKSDQLDFADLEGLPPQVYTIADVHENGTELADQQPVNIRLEEFPRVWRPSKGMLRVLADNWGKDVKVWVGRRVELYGDPDVYFGKEKRGGTRISRLSHISKAHTTLVNPRGGRSAYWTVKPLPDAPTSAPAQPDPTATLTAAIAAEGIETAQMPAFLAWASERQLGRRVGHPSELNDADRGDLLDNLPALANNFLAEVAQGGAES